jgi:hypothetical protein
MPLLNIPRQDYQDGIDWTFYSAGDVSIRRPFDRVTFEAKDFSSPWKGGLWIDCIVFVKISDDPDAAPSDNVEYWNHRANQVLERNGYRLQSFPDQDPPLQDRDTDALPDAGCVVQ